MHANCTKRVRNDSVVVRLSATAKVLTRQNLKSQGCPTGWGKALVVMKGQDNFSE